jgi:hypothetical protein
MLHVHGGDVLLARIANAGITGARLSWRDVICQGPLPRSVAQSEWRRVRADFLESTYGTGGDGTILDSLVAQEATLFRAATEEDEIVLWFSPEWFCQATLVALLAQLYPRRNRRTRVSLVDPVSVPGIPADAGCVLSQVEESQLPALLAGRREATAEIFETGREAWEALRDPKPTALHQLALRGTPRLPALAEGLTAHLLEFPSSTNGLSLGEERALSTLTDEPREWTTLFPLARRKEECPWVTDLIFRDRLKRMAGGKSPLVEWSDDGRLTRITKMGQAVLAGERDWCTLQPPDRWIGGVHLTGQKLWRIDRDRLALTLATENPRR